MRDERGTYDCIKFPVETYDIWGLSEKHTEDIAGEVDVITDNVDAITETLQNEHEIRHLLVIVIIEFYRSIKHHSSEAEDNAIGILCALFFIKYMKQFDDLSASCESSVLYDRHTKSIRETLMCEAHESAEQCVDAFLFESYQKHVVLGKESQGRSMCGTEAFEAIRRTLRISESRSLEEFRKEIQQLY